MRCLGQLDQGWLIVSNTHDHNRQIFLRQLVECAAQPRVNGKDQDADHEYRGRPLGRLC